MHHHQHKFTLKKYHFYHHISTGFTIREVTVSDCYDVNGGAGDADDSGAVVVSDGFDTE